MFSGEPRTPPSVFDCPRRPPTSLPPPRVPPRQPHPSPVPTPQLSVNLGGSIGFYSGNVQELLDDVQVCVCMCVMCVCACDCVWCLCECVSCWLMCRWGHE